jgi:hypothetical protein
LGWEEMMANGGGRRIKAANAYKVVRDGKTIGKRFNIQSADRLANKAVQIPWDQGGKGRVLVHTLSVRKSKRK